MASCHACKKELEIVGRVVGRRDECVHCGADLHCCYNCSFYEQSAHNECREPVAMRVNDKDRSNFCEYFELATKPHDGGKSAKEDAKKKLEELFRKK